MIALTSQSESARFGRPIARLTIDAAAITGHREIVDALDGVDADVVILRYPSRHVDLYHHLMRLQSHEPLFADCLMYWECNLRTRRAPTEISADLRRRQATPAEVGAIVRPVFPRYSSHYAANPLLDPLDSLEGYVEWVTTLVDNGDAICLTIDDALDSCVGFAVVDFSVETPDIKLAGISPGHRGRGRYRDLMAATMQLTAESGHDRIAISTQAHNTTVMATWAALGWSPVRSISTVHLVKRHLI